MSLCSDGATCRGGGGTPLFLGGDTRRIGCCLPSRVPGEVGRSPCDKVGDGRAWARFPAPGSIPASLVAAPAQDAPIVDRVGAAEGPRDEVIGLGRVGPLAAPVVQWCPAQGAVGDAIPFAPGKDRVPPPLVLCGARPGGRHTVSSQQIPARKILTAVMPRVSRPPPPFTSRA